MGFTSNWGKISTLKIFAMWLIPLDHVTYTLTPSIQWCILDQKILFVCRKNHKLIKYHGLAAWPFSSELLFQSQMNRNTKLVFIFFLFWHWIFILTNLYYCFGCFLEKPIYGHRWVKRFKVVLGLVGLWQTNNAYALHGRDVEAVFSWFTHTHKISIFIFSSHCQFTRHSLHVIRSSKMSLNYMGETPHHWTCSSRVIANLVLLKTIHYKGNWLVFKINISEFQLLWLDHITYVS